VLVVILINTVFGRGVLEMMPAVADVILARGSSGLAAMTSAVGAGAVLVGVVLASGTRWLDFGALRLTLFVSAVLAVVYGASTDFTLTLVAVGLLGAVLSLCGIGSQILIQSAVEDEIRGRVSSLWGMIAFGGTAFGSLIIGAIADVVGLRETLIATGVLSALVSLALPSRPSTTE
jgi:MFS family permease